MHTVRRPSEIVVVNETVAFRSLILNIVVGLPEAQRSVIVGNWTHLGGERCEVAGGGIRREYE